MVSENGPVEDVTRNQDWAQTNARGWWRASSHVADSGNAVSTKVTLTPPQPAGSVGASRDRQSSSRFSSDFACVSLPLRLQEPFLFRVSYSALSTLDEFDRSHKRRRSSWCNPAHG